MHTPEWYEKRDLDTFLAKLGPDFCYVMKQTTRGFGQSGHADRIAGIKGHFFAFELKIPGKDLRPQQVRRIQEAIRAGNIAIGGTAEECIAFLRGWLEQRGVVVRG